MRLGLHPRALHRSPRGYRAGMTRDGRSGPRSNPDAVTARVAWAFVLVTIISLAMVIAAGV